MWGYWNMARRYSHLPQCSKLYYPFYVYAFRKKPKDLSITSYAFQMLIAIMEKFRKGGICLIWFGKPYLFVFNEEYSKILSNDPSALDKLSEYQVLKDWLGTGMLTRDGKSYRMHRKMINPAFRLGVLKNHLHTMNKNAKILVKKLSRAANDPPIDILKDLKISCFYIIFETVFGFPDDCPEILNVMNAFMKHIDHLTEISIYRVMHPWLHYKFMMYFMPTGRKYLQMYKEIRELAGKIALDMKNSVLNRSTKEDDEEVPKLSPFSQILISRHLTDPPFTFEDLKDEIITFIFGGYDTIAHAMLWCLYLLGLHQDVQDQVRNEVESIPGNDVTYGDLNNLQHLESVIRESLRLYPPVPILGRKSNKDIQCGKYIVPKGTEVIFCSYMLHRDPEIYSDPEEFKPERFMTESSEYQPRILMTFSDGIRNCIGKKLAMMELKVLLSHILRNFYIKSMDKREDLDLRWNTVLAPEKPLNITFTPIENNSAN